jgi:hypothetical protein
MAFITVDNVHPELRTFLERLRLTGCTYELVIENGNIDKIHIKMPDDGNWKDIRYGRIIGSKMVAYKQKVVLPRIIDGKFIYDYNEEKNRGST